MKITPTGASYSKNTVLHLQRSGSFNSLWIRILTQASIYKKILPAPSQNTRLSRTQVLWSTFIFFTNMNVFPCVSLTDESNMKADEDSKDCDFFLLYVSRE